MVWSSGRTIAGRRLRAKTFAVLVVGSGLVLGTVAWPFTKAHLQAVAMLRLVSGQKVPWIIDRLVREPVQMEEVTFSTPGGLERARIYTPERHRDAPGLVVLHGVHHLGIDEPRLVGFA